MDTARSQLGFTQTQKKSLTGQVQQMEESLRNSQDPMERKHLQEAIPQMKNNLERVAAEEQRFQSMQIDAETQWRAEQAKLADLQDQLDRLDKVLDSFTRK
jgi:chromosome segregation ATPase